MLLVQEFLENKTFGDLVKEHGVYASFSKSGHKFSLNYDQIEAKETDPLAQECRGLVLSAEDGKSFLSQAIEVNGRLSYDHLSPSKTSILAYPMKRFFNHGQGCAATIDFNDPTLSILEKMDGTLCIVYYDPFTKQWCVATRSVPEADLLMDNGLFTFRTLFEKSIQDTLGWSFEDFTSNLDKCSTYCFELTTPYNRIVVYYPNNRITLLAMRDIRTLKEVDPKQDRQLEVLGIPIVQAHTYNSIDEIVNWVSTLNPMEHEGVVARDGNFNRIKIKNVAYVAYNKVRDKLATSERNCIELILTEKDDDVISFLPEDIVKNLQKLKLGVQAGLKQHDEAYLTAREQAHMLNPGDKKTFAILVTKNKDLWTAPFFQMWDGKASNMKDFIQKSRKDGSWHNSFLDKILEIAKNSGV
jgi:hypothetical protein